MDNVAFFLAAIFSLLLVLHILSMIQCLCTQIPLNQVIFTCFHYIVPNGISLSQQVNLSCAIFKFQNPIIYVYVYSSCGSGELTVIIHAR
jgi:hypothetical protein